MADLRRFGDAVAASIAAAGGSAAVRAASSRIFPALHGIEAGPSQAAWLPVCSHIGTALAAARGTKVAAVAEAFAELAPELAWQARPNAQGDFASGHANAQIVGFDRARLRVELAGAQLGQRDSAFTLIDLLVVIAIITGTMIVSLMSGDRFYRNFGWLRMASVHTDSAESRVQEEFSPFKPSSR